jgi:elongation factor Ts
MAEVSAKTVMALRQATGCGLMECKKALAASAGDLKVAEQKMKDAGVLKAQKKSGRVASEGLIHIQLDDSGTRAVMLEVNCETDFVARDENFIGFVRQASAQALAQQTDDLSDLIASVTADGETIEAMRQRLVQKVGENIQLRRLKVVSAPDGGAIGHYQHGDRLGALVVLDVAAAELGRDLAMHVAANRPKSISEDDFPKSELDSERAAYAAQASETGKPEDIQTRMVEGRMRKYLEAHSLLAQPFVKDVEVKVRDLLKPVKGQVLQFECYALGETA